MSTQDQIVYTVEHMRFVFAYVRTGDSGYQRHGCGLALVVRHGHLDHDLFLRQHKCT
jgi:hypothetical protein